MPRKPRDDPFVAYVALWNRPAKRVGDVIEVRDYRGRPETAVVESITRVRRHAPFVDYVRLGLVGGRSVFELDYGQYVDVA